MSRFVCAQDLREEELQKEGTLNPEKAYFRIGRAIFLIDTTEFENHWGKQTALRIKVEGDPDGGVSFGINNEILLTGYRYGLDDVLVDDKLLQTVHGSEEDIMRNFANYLDWKARCVHVPDWSTYDGLGFHIKPDPKLKNKIKRISNRIKKLAYEFEHLEDMPLEIKAKFPEVDTSNQTVKKELEE